MSNLWGTWIFLFFLFLLDLYIFQAIKTIAQTWPTGAIRWAYFLYWSITVISFVLILSITFSSYENWHKILRTYLFATIIGLFLAKFLSGIFLLVDDLRRGFQYLGSLWIPEWKMKSNGGISRSVFMSWVGFVTGGSLFGSLLYGFGNKYNYKVRKIRIRYPHLPKTFQGLKIVHISDIHSGSFTDIKAVEKGVNLIIDQKPDLILFTGDLVNYRADEMAPYIDLFSKLKAPYGIFSTLGNHDYGFPRNNNPNEREKIHLQNANEVAEVHKQLGWNLLRNNHSIIDQNNESIAIIGVDNISAKAGFPSYGNLNTAYQGSEKIPFKILLSHDPSHWNAEVTENFPDIDLTLSGHTHGMQFGLEVPGFKWSPVKYVYKQWAGLYESDKQKLYVNRGFGFIGYPGRVGILPEITVLELV